MRLLFLTHRLPYAPNRGDRIRAFHLIRFLAGSFEIHLVSLVHDDDEWSHRGDLSALTASTDVARVSRLRRALPAVLSLPGSRPLTHALLHSRSVRTVLARRIARSRPDVALVYCSGMARYALGSELQGIPFVLDLVDVDSEKWRALALESGFPRRWLYEREARLLRRFEEKALLTAASTTVVSDREREKLPASVAQRVQVVRNGVDIEWFAPSSPPSESNQVIFTGVFDYPPNQRAALWFARDVWPLVVRSRPDARLLLAGMNPPPAVQRLARDSTIQVTGAVADMRPLLWQSSLAIAPLDIARGLQNKVLEAVAAGLPCVVTPQVAAGLPRGILPACSVEPSPEGFARAVLALLDLTPPERRARAGEAKLTLFTWDRQLQPMASLLHAAAQGMPMSASPTVNEPRGSDDAGSSRL